DDGTTLQMPRIKTRKQFPAIEDEATENETTLQMPRIKTSKHSPAIEDESPENETTMQMPRIKTRKQSPAIEDEATENETTLQMPRTKASPSHSALETEATENEITLQMPRIEANIPQPAIEAVSFEDMTTMPMPRIEANASKSVTEDKPSEEAETQHLPGMNAKRSHPAIRDKASYQTFLAPPLTALQLNTASEEQQALEGSPEADQADLTPGKPGPMRRLVKAVLVRAADPRPERVLAPATDVQPKRAMSVWLPGLMLVSALGLFVVVEAYNLARNNQAGSDLYFWAGILLIFVPPLMRLLTPGPSRLERVGLLASVGICLYLVKVTLGPISFTGYDEFLHLLTANNILSTGHLFSKNTLLPVSPFFPGMEIVTNALSNLSGLSTVQSGNIVVGVARLVMVLVLFLLNEQITRSARIASIATMIYIANPHFLFFDAQFAYESLALPLAIFVMFALVRYETLSIDRRWLVIVTWVVLGALVATHHLTNFIFEGLFILWSITYVILRPYPLRSTIVLLTTLVGLVITAVSIVLVGPTLIGYFGSFFKDIWSEITPYFMSSGAAGSGGGRQLFSSYGEIPTPVWERLISLFTVGAIMLALPFSWFCLWKRYRRNPLMWVFGLMTLLYPASLLLRLTDTGSEASDRSSAFLFLGISSLLAIYIAQFWPVRRLNWIKTSLIGVTISLIFMGSIILGAGIPPSFLPGPYQVSADSRSIEPEGIQAAFWAHAYLGPNNRVATDRVNQFLMATYGGQYVVTPIGDHLDVADVFFSSVVGDYEAALLQRAQIRYLVVDMRLSTGLPQVGFYIEQGEPDSFTRTSPMDRQYLTKFSTVPQINRLFDSGNIVIYDAGGLIHASQKP
ncbi:MAG TPA: hypothetical protein VFN23_15845, partial [Ktedonobacteraceae bacterium]|nr:hypothetical protein [Ktedonobacteraceae bacterium]